MKKLIVHLFLCFIYLFAGSASATLISESQIQTTNGQNFTFNLNTTDYQIGTSSLVTVSVQADFNSGVGSSEDLAAIIIEGINYGNFGYDSASAYDVTQVGGSNFNAYRFSLDFLIDSATTNLFLADNILDINIDFGGGVTEQYGWWTTTNGERSGIPPNASVNFTYDQISTAVPEPTSLALLGLGLAGFGFTRKKLETLVAG